MVVEDSFKEAALKFPGLLYWDRITAYFLPLEGSFASIVVDNEDLVLFFSLSPKNGLVHFGQKIGGVWKAWDQVKFDFLDSVIELKIEIELNLILVKFGLIEVFSIVNDIELQSAYEFRGDLKVRNIALSAMAEAAECAEKRVISAIDDFPLISKIESKNSSLIYDVGMHDCRDTEFYLRKGFKVVAVEANPTLAIHGARRFPREIDDGSLTILNIGLGEDRGRFPFYVNDVISEWSSFDRDVASRGHPTTEIEVQQYDLRSVLKVYGIPHYLKVDIEDYDKFVIYDLPGLSHLPDYVSVENGSPPIFEALLRAGYKHFMFVNQRDVPIATLPNHSQEGRSVNHTFKYGSSGPFGTDLHGDWLDSAAMALFLERWWKTGGESDSWYDLHASLD